MINSPVYTAIPRNQGCTISAANTGRDGSGTLGTVYTASTNGVPGGSRIDALQIAPRGNTTVNVLRFFIYDGTSYHFLGETQIQAATASNTNAVTSITLSQANGTSWLPLLLSSGNSLKVSTNNAETYDVTAIFAGDFS